MQKGMIRGRASGRAILLGRSSLRTIAYLSAMRSKDPSTQVGACIVNADKRIVAIGYNGFPRGISDDNFPWSRKADDPLDTKYPYVCHAEDERNYE